MATRPHELQRKFMMSQQIVALALVSEYAYRVRYMYKNLLSYRRNILLEQEVLRLTKHTRERA